MNWTFSITFGDCAENGIGMQKIGNLNLAEGLTVPEIEHLYHYYRDQGVSVDLIDLNQALPPDQRQHGSPARVLVFRNCFEQMFGVPWTNFRNEHEVLAGLYDKKKLNPYHKVVNSKLRYNLCFGDVAQQADVDNGRGTIIAFNTLLCTDYVRKMLPALLGPKTANLVAEGNYYYDLTKCGIGYHGDKERKMVICFRVGSSMPLRYWWYYQGQRVGTPVTLTLNDGDFYIMSDKAVGYDWLKRSIYTLRHAAGISIDA